MSCTQFDFIVEGDKNNRLYNAVKDVAGHDSTKAIIMAGYVSSPDFISQVLQDTGKTNILDVNLNTLKKHLRNHYTSRAHSIAESINQKFAEDTQGFSTSRAKDIARDHTGNILLDAYLNETDKPKTNRLSRKGLIAETIRRINSTFTNDVVNPFIREIRANNDNPKALELANNIAVLTLETNRLTDEYNNLLDEESTEEVESRLDDLDDALDANESKIYVLKSNLINEFGNVRQKNYANLVATVRGNPDEWFRDVLNTNKLSKLANDLAVVVPEEQFFDTAGVDDNDTTNSDSNTVDDMAKTWENNQPTSYDKLINAKVKLYLNTLYKMHSPVQTGSTSYTYDTNNELGVATGMGENYIKTVLSDLGNFASVEDFIDSIDRLSKTNPNLYGLVKLANDMRLNKFFAKEVFVQLANPRVNTTMAILTENGIEFGHSNRQGDVVSTLVYSMMNQGRNNYRSAYTSQDLDKISNYIQVISKSKNDKMFYNSGLVQNANNNIDNFIADVLSKYFPNIDKNGLINYLHSDPNNSIEIYTSILQDLQLLITNSGDLVDQYNSEWSKFYTGYTDSDGQKIDGHKDWSARRMAARNRLETFNEPEPIFNTSSINWDKINAPILNIGKKLANYSMIKNELNSVNAEGNMSSDLVNNSYFTNFVKQIKHGTPAEQNKGLDNLYEFITKSPQYEHNPFFFGVIEENTGRVLVPGLFNRNKLTNEYTVNEDVKNLIDISLFNGAKDRLNSKAAMYSGMSKGDYFLTKLLAYTQPIDYVNKPKNNIATGGFFLSTPSDAPKNFVMQMPIYKTDGLIEPTYRSSNEYINTVLNDFTKQYKFTTAGQFATQSKELLFLGKPKNKVDASSIYDILKNGAENRNYGEIYHEYNPETNKVTFPLYYSKDDARVIVWLQGDKDLETTNNVAINLEVVEVYAPKIDASGRSLPDQFVIDTRDQFIADGVADGAIAQQVNRNNVAFRALHQHLTQELETFVHNLNNVFENVNGEWVSKTNTNNLIERGHFNGDGVVDNKRLTGNLFQFKRLYNIEGIDVDQLIKDGLFLYGGDRATGTPALMSAKRNGRLQLNQSREDLIDFSSSTIKLLQSPQLKNTISDIVEQWINSFSRDVLSKTAQYQTIINDNGLITFSNNQIFDAMLNGAIAEMNFDDLFFGDVKFYKDAQTFLKRAKEGQAGGKLYGNINLNNDIGGHIKNLLDSSGKTTVITINGREINLPRRENGTYNTSPMTARNGFRAVTINNTVRASENAANIKQELLDILTPQVGETEANRIVTDIAKGYFATTAVDDAQSYITLEEFIARKEADGTLAEYEDILSQLLDDSVGINDIDLSDVNARIQVQKNFYFDKQFDENTGTYYPRQIKNAEFVLIPKLLPEGSSLRGLYDIMKAHDIGQVNTAETSKAAKKNVLSYWDEKGVANPESFIEQLEAGDEIAIEDYYYQYLYKQQDVADHMTDQTNKAGIQIMKKLIDNASAETQGNIDNFFSSYVANIKEDFNLLLDRMGWTVVDNKLVSKDSESVDQDGNSILNFGEFYKRARIEAQRLGMDSNFIEYLTPSSEDGEPNMPNFMNNVSSKLESIAQSIFNNSVTRQTLPGWHAAQVTSVGYGNALNEQGVIQELRYHPQVTNEDGVVTQEAYAEVMLPRWSNLIPKDYDINNLEKEGLTIQLGYRIPTEGKQSVSVLKVVGFLDSIYGSTIIVPDEWVTQTGSDFDVDSVYGITKEMYKNYRRPTETHGYTIEEVQFDTDTSEEGVQRRYMNYVNRNIEQRVEKDKLTDEFITSEINELRDQLRDVITRQNESNYFDQFLEHENTLYNALPVEFKDEVKSINRRLRDVDIIERYNAIANVFNIHAENTPAGEVKDLLEEFAETNEGLAYVVQKGRDYYNTEWKAKKSDKLNDLFEGARKDYLNKVKEVAKKAKLPSIEEFAEWSIEEQNNRKARNNRILQSMINIMNSPASREENYSRSNFEDLADAMAKNKELKGIRDSDVSRYSPFDQIDFMGNAMSGATLKSFSVTRDTFNSVNNYIGGKLSDKHSFTVEYPIGEYTEAQIRAAYDNVEVNKDKGVIVVTHNRLANSNNNRNVVGKLLTPYSSQTTAHILDVIKEGTIPNENEYTFGTFKTLIDTGVDYDTAIAFLMQPGVDYIVNSYFETNSVYINSSSNPIRTAIKKRLADAGYLIDGKPITIYTPFDNIKNLINGNVGLANAFGQLFGAVETIDIDRLGQRYPINKTMLQNRLKSVGITNNTELSDVNNIAFDIAMIIEFNNIRNTTLNIEALARVSNPDKFGAKQTIRETRKILDNIIKFSREDSAVGSTVLDRNNTRFTQSIYPGFDYNNDSVGTDVMTGEEVIAEDAQLDIGIERSSYPYLAAFLKYATVPSVEANSKLFPTESDQFNVILDEVQRRLGVDLTEQQYKEYKQYMVSNAYNAVPFLSTPLTVNEFGQITVDNVRYTENAESNKEYWNEERRRIFGHDVINSASMEFKDINNPTVEEIDKFNTLTPAQKAIVIQEKFGDNKGIFGYLDVNLNYRNADATKGGNPNTIKFSDQVDNIEELFSIFNSSFFNKNPLVKLATMDLIKYAFVVEGFKFKKGGISKLITNNSISRNLEDRGFNLIAPIKKSFFLYTNPMEGATEAFIDKFVRSHSDIVKEVNIPYPIRDKQGVENIGFKMKRYFDGDNVLFIPFNKASKDVLEFINIDENHPKGYIRLTRNMGKGRRETTLYRIIDKLDGVYLAPMNLLERNETADISIVSANNKFRQLPYYTKMIDAAIENNVSIKQLSQDARTIDLVRNARAEFTIRPQKVRTIVETTQNVNELNRILNHGTARSRAEVDRFVRDIVDYLTSPVEELIPKYGVVYNDNSYISSLVPNGGIIQNIPVGDEMVKVFIGNHRKTNRANAVLHDNKGANIDLVPIEERKAVDKAVAAKAKFAKMYRIERIVEEDVREEYHDDYDTQTEESNERRNAFTNPISDIEVDSLYDFSNIDDVAKDMFNELNDRALRDRDTEAIQFKRGMDLAGVDRFSSVSIKDNRRNIYSSAADYYAIKSKELLDAINNFKVINPTDDTKQYSINDPEFFKYLRNNHEDFPILLKLVLDAKTLGGAFYDIFNLDIVGEDPITTNAIKTIRKSITDVRTNSKLNEAINLIFNDYIANNYSTNPNIRREIVNLTDIFGDTDTFDLWLSNITELNNTQVQAVVKSINSMLAYATQDIAPRAVATFNKQFSAIMGREGSFSMDNVIDKQGKFVTPYNDEFLKDREKVIEDVKKADEAYGRASIQYHKAVLARDKWKATNLQQEVANSYYNQDVTLRDSVIKQAPEEYVEYKRLQASLYEDKKKPSELTEEEREHRSEIMKQMRQLTSDFREDGDLKSDEERFRANRLELYLNKKKELEEEFFDYKESNGFAKTLAAYRKDIDNFEKTNPNMPLDERLQDDNYREAYDWVQENTIYKLNDEAQAAISAAFEVLKSKDHVKSSGVKSILKAADAYDKFGNIDARKLSPADITKIRNLTMSNLQLMYDTSAGESSLIKEVPKNQPVIKDEFYRRLRPTDYDSDSQRLRLSTIGRINELLGLAVDGHTGEIRTKDLFENLTQDQLLELADLYDTLRDIYREKRESKEKDVTITAQEGEYSFVNNESAYNREWAYAEQHLKNSTQRHLWNRIFGVVDQNGVVLTNEETGDFLINSYLLGYMDVDSKWINKEKTAARNTIENNVRFVPNEYYYAAIREVSDNGTFDQWYKDNHVFNPYTHKMEPLKVWTKMEINPNGELKGTYEYVPTFENKIKNVKPKYINHNYKHSSSNYNIETGKYNNLNRLSGKERDMLDLLQSTMQQYTSTHSMEVFANKGFAPRRRAAPKADARYYIQQSFGALGLEVRNPSERRWSDKIDYANDFDPEFDMMQLLKQKGYEERIRPTPQGTIETDEQYAKRISDIREKNKEIDANNLKLDNDVLDRDWQSVFQDFIAKATEYNARQRSKNMVYLLLEHIKDNQAYSINPLTGSPRIDGKKSTKEKLRYRMVNQENTHKIVENWARRVLFNEYKKNSDLGKYADVLQNITSAKYMIFNVLGGIKNVSTGLSNIYGEVFAKDYFGNNHWNKANSLYRSNVTGMLADMYKETSNNLVVALAKKFDVVDFDAYTERRPNETASNYVKRVRDSLYGLQSMGEHYLHNTSLLAILESHRVFKDTDGQIRVGSIANYNWEVEMQTLFGMLKNDPDTLTKYKHFIKNVKQDIKEVYKYATFTKDFNEQFLRDVGDKNLINKYIENRKEALAKAAKDFETFPKAMDQFELVDGLALIKEGSQMTGEMFGELRQKVISVNEKIHGVYSKIGAASIESNWWGSLVMQYHKHIYPGIMKRYRLKGYYNEVRGSVEVGSYTSLARFLGAEFEGIGDRVKNRTDESHVALASIREVIKSATDTILNLKMNYNLMPVWEQNNMKRILGDLLGTASAILTAIGLYMITDDDELKDSELLASVLYLSQAMHVEASMYFPWQLIGEAKTMWSSPIAAQNAPLDLIKGLGITADWLFDDDFSIDYTTGLYKGENKLAVLAYRNTPIYRVYNRLSNMTKNNSYYRLNESSLDIKTAKGIADAINPD